MKYFKFVSFVASFIIGLFILSFFKETKQIVYVYPTPENIKEYMFQDDTDNCFILDMEEMNCPQDKTLIFKTPIQSQIKPHTNSLNLFG